MNRIQFFVLTGLSSLVLLLLLGHIYLVHTVSFDQGQLNAVQQRVTQAQSFQENLKQLAVRIYQDAQKTQDPGLKELLDRQQIKYTPAASTNSADTSAPANPTPNH
jgi:hypothetical protein